MPGGLLVTVVYSRELQRCRLTAMGLDEDGPVPAGEVRAALTSAADELKFQMRLSRERQAAPGQGEAALAPAGQEQAANG